MPGRALRELLLAVPECQVVRLTTSAEHNGLYGGAKIRSRGKACSVVTAEVGGDKVVNGEVMQSCRKISDYAGAVGHRILNESHSVDTREENISSIKNGHCNSARGVVGEAVDRIGYATDEHDGRGRRIGHESGERKTTDMICAGSIEISTQ